MKQMDDASLRNKVAGALYGQALGDAFGMPPELWGRKRTRAFFGGPITEMLDGPAENDVAFNYVRGQFTDDTGQALVLLDSLSHTGYRPDARDIAERMLAWADRENAFANNILGPTTKLALAAFREGRDASPVTDKALSNGAAMRIGPVGAMLPSDRPDRLVEFVYGVTRATHTSDVTIAGASMVAEGVASAIVHDDFDTVLGDILAIEPAGYDRGAETCSPRLAERVNIGIDIARKYQGRDKEFLEKVYDIVGAGVPIIESVPAAITIAYYAQDPNRSALLCANLCGDTDTIGAMATSICGAFTGAEAILPEYRATIARQNHVDFSAYTDILMAGRAALRVEEESD